MYDDLRKFLLSIHPQWRTREVRKKKRLNDLLNQLYPNISTIEQVYRFLNNISEVPLCKSCHIKPVSFHGTSDGYNECCSKKCMNKYRKDSGRIEAIIEKTKKTNIVRFGVDVPVKSQKIREKMYDTNLTRYGVKHASQADIIKEKVKQTSIRNHGVEYTLQSKAIREKINQTNLEKYGGHPLQNKDIQEKVKNTNMSRYGVEHVLQDEKVKEKIKQTNLKKYGVEHPAQDSEVLGKMKHTTIDRYGVDNFTQINISKEILDILQNKERLNEFLLCNSCYELGKLFKISPTTVSAYARKYCINDGYRSNIEKFLAEWLDTLGLEFRTDRKILNPREIDRYCKERQFGIELDGLSFHSEILGQKDHLYHKWKTDECEKQGIHLIHIFEDEWYDRREAVQDIIKTQLGIQERGVGARKLKIVVIDNEIAKNFFELHHVQGSSSFNICVGAYHDDTLVGVMGFGRPTRQSKYQYELKRYCTDGKIYPGLASRLLKYFIKQYNPSSIVSFCDRRYFMGESYLKMGFRYDGSIPPDYSYTCDYRTRHHKSKFKLANIRKKFPDLDMDGKTEWQCMRELGFDRIWDCGKKRFVWERKLDK